MKLTCEQQKLVEDNEKLIYWYMNRNRLEVSEWYGFLAIEMCLCAQKFDPSRGSSFSNYFKVRADNALATEYSKLKAQKRSHNGMCNLTDVHHEMDYDSVEDIVELKTMLEGEHSEILRLKAHGYTQTEIAEMVGLNQGQVSKILMDIRGKLNANR